MMVMKSNIPKKICISHAHKPPKTIQMTLRGKVMQTLGLSPSLTSAPNGHKQSKPILKVCNAMGMPIMVQAITKLPVKYPIAASRPPKSHHSRFPIIYSHYYCLFYSPHSIVLLFRKNDTFINQFLDLFGNTAAGFSEFCGYFVVCDSGVLFYKFKNPLGSLSQSTL